MDHRAPHSSIKGGTDRLVAPGKERQWESLSFWLGCVMCEA